MRYYGSMIGQLTGTISYKGPQGLIVDVGGIGYKVAVTAATHAEVELGSTLTLWTHLAVRENALDLYGFSERPDLVFFELLLEVSGIGPKTALGVLNMAGAATLERAILSGDASYLTKVSGIGAKSANKIVLELKDKLAKLGKVAAEKDMREETDAIDALMSLGYTLRDARDALTQVKAEHTTTNAKVREALKLLAQK
jgi:holliday junction DNA helicase RuvA